MMEIFYFILTITVQSKEVVMMEDILDCIDYKMDE